MGRLPSSRKTAKPVTNNLSVWSISKATQDFCFAATWARKLLSPTQNRIILAFSSSSRQANFLGGKSFSHALFQQVQKGKSLAEAFEAARLWSDANAGNGPAANPEAYANPDVVPNDAEKDLSVLRQIYLGGSQQYQNLATEWKDLQLILDPVSRELTVRAMLADSTPLDRAWFSILPSIFDPRNSGEAALPSAELQAIGDGTYAGRYFLREEEKGMVLVTAYGHLNQEQLLPLSREIGSASTLRVLNGLEKGRFGFAGNQPILSAAAQPSGSSLHREDPCTCTSEALVDAW